MTDIEKQAREEYVKRYGDHTNYNSMDTYLVGYMKGVEREKKLRECVELFLEDYAKKEFTYGWQDLMARKFRQCLKELGE